VELQEALVVSGRLISQGWFNPTKDGPMKCPNCVLGDLQFVIRGELRFKTDAKGRPSGTADIHTATDKSWLICDTCDANFRIEGWREDGSGHVILFEAEDAIEETGIEVERESPPPSLD
jgi:hypothetical protein